LAKSAGRTATRAFRKTPQARVALLIPTHALPPLSYRVPERLRTKVRVGTAVVAPLSGRLRLGIVVGTEEAGGHAREDLRSIVESLSITPDLVDLCAWVSETAAVPLPVVLRAALPPSLDTGRYRVVEPAPGWPWKNGDLVARATLKRALGREGLRAAESVGRIVLSPAPPERPTVEWAVAENAPDLSRAPRQRELFELLKENEGGCRTAILLSDRREPEHPAGAGTQERREARPAPRTRARLRHPG